jgi:hypothetical protein
VACDIVDRETQTDRFIGGDLRGDIGFHGIAHLEPMNNADGTGVWQWMIKRVISLTFAVSMQHRDVSLTSA